MNAQTTNFGTMDRNGKSCKEVKLLGQFGVAGEKQIDFALVSFDGNEELVQIRDGKILTITSYPATMTARQAYEATLAHNANAEVFTEL